MTSPGEFGVPGSGDEVPRPGSPRTGRRPPRRSTGRSLPRAATRPRDQFVLGNLDAPTMTAIASEMGAIELAGMDDGVVTFEARRDEGGGGGPFQITSEIQVVRDADGAFRIVEF